MSLPARISATLAGLAALLAAACASAPAAGPPAPPRDRVLLDVDLTAGNAGPGQVTGGAWEGGWRVTSRAGERIVFDAGRPVAAGFLEVSYTMRRRPHEGEAAKINWVGLHEDQSLSQNRHDGDIFYVRAGNPSYRYSKVKAYGRRFDRTEWESSIGAESDWSTDDRAVQTVRLEWRDGAAVFHDPHGRRFACPPRKCSAALPIDRLRYVFLGSDRYNDISLEGIRFLRVRLVEYPEAAAPTPSAP